MKTSIAVNLRPSIVKLLGRFIRPLADEGVITILEEKTILSNLRYLATKGQLQPVVIPKLIDQKEAANMLGIGHSNFKKMEQEGLFPFSRKMVGSSVRYRNLDIIDFIMTEQGGNYEYAS